MITNPYGLNSTEVGSPRAFGPTVKGIPHPFQNSRNGGVTHQRALTNLGTSRTVFLNPTVASSVNAIPAGYTLPSTNNFQEALGTGPIQGESRMEYIPYERKYIDY